MIVYHKIFLHVMIKEILMKLKKQLCRDSLETTENIKSKMCVTHSSYITICHSLHNNMRNDDQISN